jgi:hypothetical protein
MQQTGTYFATFAKRALLFYEMGICNLSNLFPCLDARLVRLANGEPLMHTGEKADRL